MKALRMRWINGAAAMFALGAALGVSGPAAAESFPAPASLKLENNADLYLEQIRGIQKDGRYYASLAHLDDFALRWKDNDQATLLRAQALEGIGQTDKARELYKGLLDGKLAAKAYHGLGMIDLKAGHTDDAVDALNRAAALAPIDAEILNDQGGALMAAGKLDEARQSLLRASELDAKSKAVGANLAQLQIREGQPKEADETMRRYAFPAPVQQEIRQKAAEQVKKEEEAKKKP